MHILAAIGVGSTVGGLVMASVFPAQAAMRVCQGEVSSGLQRAKTELEARAMAIASWNKLAGVYGDGYLWTGATNKFLNCSPHVEGFQCLAKALPCTISQVPLPPGSFKPVSPGGVKG